jgi:membrane associated rhomboid family serine protease
MPAWATVFTSMFLHGSISHFAFNMLFLWVFGDNVEDRFGHIPYLVFYLLSGVAAAAAQVAIDPTSEVPMIGASGAIAGALGGYFLMYPFHRIRTLVIFIFITSIEIRAMWLLGFWIVMQFFGGLGSLGPSVQGQGGVAYFAHIGGFIAGMAIVAVMKLLFWREPLWRPERRRDDFWWRGRRL